jgi:predicted nucleic-acid-binding Zn-ribbon protein
MPVYWDATARTVPFVRVQCENCGHHYGYSHPIGITRRSNSRDKANELVGEDLKNEISWRMRIVENEDYAERGWWLNRDGLGDAACPKCGYTQSWQVNVRQGRFVNKWTNRIGFIVAALIFAYVAFVYAPIKDSILFNLFLALCAAMPVAAVFAVAGTYLLAPLVERFYPVNQGFESISVRHKPQLLDKPPQTKS